MLSLCAEDEHERGEISHALDKLISILFHHSISIILKEPARLTLRTPTDTRTIADLEKGAESGGKTARFGAHPHSDVQNLRNWKLRGPVPKLLGALGPSVNVS